MASFRHTSRRAEPSATCHFLAYYSRDAVARVGFGLRKSPPNAVGWAGTRRASFGSPPGRVGLGFHCLSAVTTNRHVPAEVGSSTLRASRNHPFPLRRAYGGRAHATVPRNLSPYPPLLINWVIDKTVSSFYSEAI